MEHISDNLFDNLMHLNVCIGVRFDVCKLGNSHSPLYTGLELYILINVQVEIHRFMVKLVCVGENVYVH